MTGNTPQSIIEKLWNSHHVLTDEGESLMHVDVALAQENTLHAFTELEKSGRKVARPQQIFAFTDHYVPTTGRAKGTDAIADLGIRNMVIDMQDMANKHGVTLFGMAHEQQGIMHIVAPEQGIIQPGLFGGVVFNMIDTTGGGMHTPATQATDNLLVWHIDLDHAINFDADPEEQVSFKKTAKTGKGPKR